ncbi:ketosynthase chain-length factor [Streptomyces sp. NBC_00258]|uniref:ketosynthase chain-length factor n=1 Tax=Streptomyces sp. NBC_00258 TaxID=2903642 RepID=UPI002E28CD53|nr:ketosynthase chain-length factor [Streptomyces sp. NBC_00258]
MNAAVVTGIGVVAPNGMSTEEYWNAALEARSGIRRITRFPPDRYRATLAGEISGFDPAAHLPSRLVPQTDHSTRLSLVAADEAIRDAGLDPWELPEYGVGVVTANSAGGFEFGHQELDNLWRKGPEYVSAYQSFAWFYAVNTGQISIRHALRGPSGVLVADEAGGLDALAQARRLLRRDLNAVVTGAVDGSLCPWGWIAQTAAGHLSTAEDPALAYRPFDEEAAGFVPGEGGAILVMEDEAAARMRGAPQVHGRLLGYAATFDPKPGTAPGDDASALCTAIELALADADADAGDIDAVFADAAGIPDFDRAEAAALGAVFGAREVPVAIPKTLTGRLCAGAGPLDVATALLALRDGVLPAAAYTRPSPRYGLNVVVDRPLALRMRAVLVVARGLGGFNSAMVVGGAH